MKVQEIKFRNLNDNYSILIGNNIVNLLPKKINELCPETQKIALIFDKNVSIKNKKATISKLKKYELFIFNFYANEKTKSLKYVNQLLDKLFKKNFNRSDLVISIGGGITGDTVGFVSSIFKRGINFINIPIITLHILYFLFFI